MNECNASMSSLKVAAYLLMTDSKRQASELNEFMMKITQIIFSKGIKLANLWLKMICESHRYSMIII